MAPTWGVCGPQTERLVNHGKSGSITRSRRHTLLFWKALRAPPAKPRVGNSRGAGAHAPGNSGGDWVTSMVTA